MTNEVECEFCGEILLSPTKAKKHKEVCCENPDNIKYLEELTEEE